MSELTAKPLVFKGAMRAGSFTAQLFVKLTVSSTSLTLSALGRSFHLQREHFEGLEATSILKIFKRGIRFRHCQPDLPSAVIFYPSLDRDLVWKKLNELGWR